MMQIRCQWCGWTYTMPRDALLYAVAKAQAEKAIHHVENCPKCRHALKIQVAELKRRIPPNTPLPEYVPPETAKEVKEIEEIKEKAETKEVKETVETKVVEEKKAPPKKVEEVKPKKAMTKPKATEKKATAKKKK